MSPRAPSGPPLVDAAKNGDREAVRALVQTKVDVNAADADGTTALHWVSYRDDLESVNLLIAAGANVNAANDLGATPLWIACENGGAALVAALLEGRRESQPGAARRRDAADGGVEVRQGRRSSSNCSTRARTSTRAPRADRRR